MSHFNKELRKKEEEDPTGFHHDVFLVWLLGCLFLDHALWLGYIIVLNVIASFSLLFIKIISEKWNREMSYLMESCITYSIVSIKDVHLTELSNKNPEKRWFSSNFLICHIEWVEKESSHFQGRYFMFKVTHNTCSLHLVSNFQNSSKHTKPSIENSTSLW